MNTMYPSDKPITNPDPYPIMAISQSNDLEASFSPWNIVDADSWALSLLHFFDTGNPHNPKFRSCLRIEVQVPKVGYVKGLTPQEMSSFSVP